jgi:ABC-2 type transport system permease protein
MNNLLMLVRREVWEHRSLWIAPLVLAGVILVIALFGGVHVSEDDPFWFGHLDDGMTAEDRRHAIEQMSPPPNVRKAIIAGVFSMLTMVQLLVLGIVVFFYLLDCLLAERRDRSILFWKSLPVSDSAVVASKALTALVAAPLFVLAVSALMQVLFAGIAAIRLGDLPFVPWDTVTWLKVQVMLLGFVPMVVLWYLPIAGYLMVVSVWSRKNAFLWAVLPWVALMIVEGLIMRSGHHVAEFLGDRFGGFATLMAFSGRDDFEAGNLVGAAYEHIGRVFADWEIWVGAVAGLALIAAATRIRRYRDDS